MSSKTGWGIDNAECVDQASLVPHKGVVRAKRWCVRIDPAPERMTLAELKAAIKRGWWVKSVVGYEYEFLVCRKAFDYVEDYHHGEYKWEYITAARPHDEAPWTEIVG